MILRILIEENTRLDTYASCSIPNNNTLTLTDYTDAFSLVCVPSSSPEKSHTHTPHTYKCTTSLLLTMINNNSSLFIYKIFGS